MSISAVTWSSTVACINVLSLLPPHTSLAPLASASSMRALQRCTVVMSTTEPSTTGPLRGSPRGRALARSPSFATNASATALSTMMRSVDMQIWPELANAPNTVPATAASMSASSSTSSGALPPSSSTTGLRYLAQVCAMMRPTLVEPVKLMRRTAGWATMASTTAPASAGALVTKFTTPGGKPASCSASMMRPCVAGHSSDPFRITVLPQASGVAMARTPRMTGAFHGAMPSTTPAAWRTPMARLPGTSDGITSPAICVVRAAASCSRPAARCTLKPAHMPEAPVSAAMATAKSAVRASSACAALSSSARRALGPRADQAGKA